MKKILILLITLNLNISCADPKSVHAGNDSAPLLNDDLSVSQQGTASTLKLTIIESGWFCCRKRIHLDIQIIKPFYLHSIRNKLVQEYSFYSFNFDKYKFKSKEDDKFFLDPTIKHHNSELYMIYVGGETYTNSKDTALINPAGGDSV